MRGPVSALYCPIGRHRDHRVTVLAVRRYHKALPGGVALYLYEDLPYPHHTDLLTPAEVTAKLAMVALYVNQLGLGADRIESFTAAMDGRGVPHETVWRLRGPQG